MVRNGATFDHQSDEVLGVAWIENPIDDGPQTTVLGNMALQRCWHPRIQDLVAHRRKEAAEVGQIKGVLRKILPLANRQYRWIVTSFIGLLRFIQDVRQHGPPSGNTRQRQRAAAHVVRGHRA